MPALAQQLLALPPAAKLLGGSFMILLAFGAAVMMFVAEMGLVPGAYAGWVLILLAGALGPMLVYQGATELRARAIDDEELARAQGELHVLKEAVAAQRAGKRGVERFLMERGYTSHKVRRWIALECGVVLPASSLL